MKKVLAHIVYLAIAFAFIRCGSNQVIYKMAEDRFVFGYDSIPYGQKKILQESSASFLTYEFNEGKEPLKVHVRFNGLMPDINSIENIHLELQQTDEKGAIRTVQPKELREFHAEYFNGKARVSTPLKNERIGTQINWKEADWTEHSAFNSVDFVGTFVFDMEEYPSSLIMKFRIIWKESEKQFETTLTKGDYKGPKFNPKF